MSMISLATSRVGNWAHPGSAGRRASAAGRPVHPPLPGRPSQRRVVVCVDSSPGAAEAFALAASQARQRNAVLDVVHVIPVDADLRAATMARVRLGEFTRRVCPYGVGTQVRLNIVRGDPEVVRPMLGAAAEVVIADHDDELGVSGR